VPYDICRLDARAKATIDYSYPELELRPHTIILASEFDQFVDEAPTESEESIGDIILKYIMPEPLEQFQDEDVEDDALLAATEQLERYKRKWDMEEDIVVYPDTEHREHIIWKPASSRLLIDPNHPF